MTNLCLEARAFPVAALGYGKEVVGVSLLRRELSKAVQALTILTSRRVEC